ncbi:MAG: CRISPR-associated endonuclease Cas3'' [Candidatus Eisenbacteria bacterium]|uniref:CRISPR-associated endonuclease Cas3 n=1 Tax=Eiseniibacteriota bacterium TaxID=2212470 RepID=A0A956NAJ5_UNCEI|nr:CRISPR-associated endonuclease Cas3'' [Candidatus Eisenbacteria bacterium]
MDYPSFFRSVTGMSPYPYQVRLGEHDWPDLLDIPTGLGKTAAVVVSWLWKLSTGSDQATRRLVYCLPMRVLVDQTADAARRWIDAARPTLEAAGCAVPTVAVLRGGDVDDEWDANPDRPCLIVGTQDLLLSRALNRGYAMSRYRWPIHFAWLHNDATWVFDETQLMGVGVETGSQLQAFRDRLGTAAPSRSLWMSATLDPAQLRTVDWLDDGRVQRAWTRGELGADDLREEAVLRRTTAVKPLSVSKTRLEAKDKNYARDLAKTVVGAHGTSQALTLVVVNRVARAQEIFRALQKLDPPAKLALVHARMRAQDRREQESVLLEGEGSRIVVATQAIEAGVDVSAETLFTELAPWPSLVQRFGRCNRRGESAGARVVWVDVDDKAADEHPPYAAQDLHTARGLLETLTDAGPTSLGAVAFTPPSVVRPVVRRKDLLELFDTTPDLLGQDLDVSRFVRDEQDTDVLVYWRPASSEDETAPSETEPAAHAGELCRVGVGNFRGFLDKLRKRERAEKVALAWTWNTVAGEWERLDGVRPGQVIRLDVRAGGYEDGIGWTGDTFGPGVTPVAEAAAVPMQAMEDDRETESPTWVPLTDHLADVEREAGELVGAVLEDGASMAASWPGGAWSPERVRSAVRTAARWHDVGKAHREFQSRLLRATETGHEPPPAGDGPWAKAGHRRMARHVERRYFRHELASALAWRKWAASVDDASRSNSAVVGEDRLRALVAYLIAAHHGKVRLSIRSVPGETRPNEGVGATGNGSAASAQPRDPLFARGVWHGDVLPSVALPDGTVLGPIELDLSCMKLGPGSWLEEALSLRDDPELGPFRLAYLESLVRIADWRGSAKPSTPVGRVDEIGGGA